MVCVCVCPTVDWWPLWAVLSSSALCELEIGWSRQHCRVQEMMNGWLKSKCLWTLQIIVFESSGDSLLWLHSAAVNTHHCMLFPCQRRVRSLIWAKLHRKWVWWDGKCRKDAHYNFQADPGDQSFSGNWRWCWMNLLICQSPTGFTYRPFDQLE